MRATCTVGVASVPKESQEGPLRSRRIVADADARRRSRRSSGGLGPGPCRMGVAYAQTVSAFTMLQFLKQHLETIQNAHFRVEMVKVYHTILNFVCTSCREEKISSLVWTSESFSSDT